MSREQIHENIDELLGLMGVQNDRLSLRTEKISQLDIDVLRKQCIELYDEVNKLALMGKLKTTMSPPVSEKPQRKSAEPIPKFTPEIETQIEDVDAESLITTNQTEDRSTKKSKVKNPVKTKPSNDTPEDEMLSLFEKFNSKPITSVPRAISVAKRFEFQSEFFDGDASSYKEFMSQLDNAEGREAAFAIYHEAKDRLSWENEDLKDELKVLMYRKHKE
jgi:hypothetical protein